MVVRRHRLVTLESLVILDLLLNLALRLLCQGV
jgi:hypothetical protein